MQSEGKVEQISLPDLSFDAVRDVDVDDGGGRFAVTESSSYDLKLSRVFVKVCGTGVPHRVEVEVGACDPFSDGGDVVS